MFTFLNTIVVRVFFLIFFCSVTSIRADVSSMVFYKPFLKTPVVYRGTFVGVSSTNVFAITKINGNIDWISQDGILPGADVSVYFNTVLFLNNQSKLVALDYRFGQKIWESSDSVLNYLVGYPYVAFLGKSNVVGVLDFVTGKVVWQRTLNRTVDCFSFVGQNGVLGLVMGKDLSLVYAQNGNEYKKVELPKKFTQIVSAWNEGLVFEHEKEFYTFLFEKNVTVKSELIPTKNGRWFDEHYYLTYDERRHRLETREVKSNAIVWLETKVPTGCVVAFAPPFVFAKTPSQNMLVYQVNRDSHLRGVSDLNSKIDLNRQMYVDGKVVYMVSPTHSTLVNLGSKSSKKWMKLSWTTSQ